VEIAK